ncbi:MAG: hypothetical protein R3F03_00510 [Opitutaceae bacterium]
MSNNTPSHCPLGNRLVVMGNAGSGKSHLAQTISLRFGIPTLSLDAWFWTDVKFTAKRDTGEVLALIESHKVEQQWIAEGVFGEFIERFLDRTETLVWLDLDWETCRDSIQARWDATTDRSPHLVKSFAQLMTYAGDYWTRTDGRSWEGHRRLFEVFSGRKWHLHSRAEADAFLARYLAVG